LLPDTVEESTFKQIRVDLFPYKPDKPHELFVGFGECVLLVAGDHEGGRRIKVEAQKQRGSNLFALLRGRENIAKLRVPGVGNYSRLRGRVSQELRDLVAFVDVI
jgi:hypothetical protein